MMLVCSFSFFKHYLFIWLHLVLVAACRIQFPNRGLNLGPQQWKHSLSPFEFGHAPWHVRSSSLTGVEPTLPALEAWSHNYWTAREVPSVNGLRGWSQDSGLRKHLGSLKVCILGKLCSWGCAGICKFRKKGVLLCSGYIRNVTTYSLI